MVTEVGRQPWIVHGYMKVEQAATTNQGVWITFLVVARRLYTGVGVTLILILRKMSRRFRDRRRGDRSGRPVRARASRVVRADRRRGRGPVSDVVAVILLFGITAYALFGGADFGAGFWDLIAGGAERGARPRAVIAHSIGPVWEANHVWLIFCSSCCGPASRRRSPRSRSRSSCRSPSPRSASCLRGVELRVPQGGVAHLERAQLRRRVRVVVGARAVLHRRRRRRDRLRTGTGRRQGRRPVVELDQPHLDPRRRARRHGRARSSPSVYLVWDARRLDDPEMVDYFRHRAVGRIVVAAGVVAFVGFFVLHDYANYVFDGLTSRALPLVILSALCGIGSLVLLAARCPHRGHASSRSAQSPPSSSAGASPSGPTSCPTRLKVSHAAAPDGTLTTILVVFVLAAIIILPSLGLLYVLDQKSILESDDLTTPSQPHG